MPQRSPARPPRSSAVSRGLVAAIALALTACSLGTPATPRRAGASLGPRSRLTSPKPSAPGASARPGASAAKLVRPATGTATLRGRVTLEAAYALARGGSLLAGAAGPGAAVAVGGAHLDAASGRLLSNNGGGLISDGGGNVVATGGAGLAADLGDGTLVAGGALISDAAGSYALAATAAADLPPAGTELPAAGMLVSVVSLADRRYLPLGQDEAGEPVYAVYSNLAGDFEVHVPQDAPANLLVVASAAGQRDRRLSLNVVVADRAGPAAVDELGRMVTRYVRRAFTGRLAAALRALELAKALAAVEPSVTERARADMMAFIDRIGALAAEGGLPADADDARVNLAAQRIVDLVLADLDLAALRIDEADVARWSGRAPAPVLETYRTGLGDILAGAAARLRADPEAFSQAYLADVINAPVGDPDSSPPIGDWTGAIRTPGDVGEFLLVEYFGSVRANVAAPFRRLSADLHGALDPAATPEARLDKAYAAEDLLYGAGMQSTVSLVRHFLASPALAAATREIFAAP